MSAPDSLESKDQRLARRSGLLLLYAGIVAPLAWGLGYSLVYSLGGIGLLGQGWTLRHWQSALMAGGLPGSLMLSVSVAMVVTALTTISAVTLTLMAPPRRKQHGLAVLLCIPLATPPAVAALMAYQVLNPGGLLGRLAFHAGGIDSPSEFVTLINDRWALGIVLAQWFTSLPLLAMFLRAAWSSARIARYCRLAESLGASPWQARRRIALPMLLQRAAPLITLIFLWQLGTYEIPLLLGRQSPQMFSVLTQRHFGQFDLDQRPEAFALAVTYLLLTGGGLLGLLVWRGRNAQ